MGLDELVLTEGRGPVFARFDEHGSVDTATYSEKDEDEELEDVPVGNVADLEEDDFSGAIGVEELEGEGRYNTAEEGAE
jgi:hypothetical protein